MSDRRINPALKVEEPSNLKEIANRLKKLPFRDMMKLCELLNSKQPAQGFPASFAEALLAVSDEILNPPAPDKKGY